MMLSIEDAQAVESEETQERLTKLLDMAFWHNQAGNIDAAILACEAALMIQPNSTTAHSLLGSLYEKKGDDAKAIQHFEAVVRLNPDSAADAAKLDQIRRGVRVKAVAPPPSHNWLPPAFLKAKRDGWKAAFSTPKGPIDQTSPAPERPRKSVVIAGAVAATLVVLIAGLMVIRPSRPVDAETRAVNMSPQGMSRTTTASMGASPAMPAPMVLKPRASTPHTVIGATPDPFGETLPPGAKTTALVKSKHQDRSDRTASLPVDSGAPLSLPPLKLRAVPFNGGEGGGLAPAPVAAPMVAAVSNVPQHTVVVPSLGRSFYPPAQTVANTAPQYNGYNPSPSQSNLASHIKITIDDSPSANSVSISDHGDAPSTGRGASGSGEGDAYQQTALGLQQQGDYRGAKAAYQKAIKAYRSQIANGQNADAASQGLAASQTGLQICDQGQQ